jgi:hypothetical protein
VAHEEIDGRQEAAHVKVEAEAGPAGMLAQAEGKPCAEPDAN